MKCATVAAGIGLAAGILLLQPCVAPERPYETLADVALILTDQVEALDCVNGRIGAIDTILTEAEKEH